MGEKRLKQLISMIHAASCKQQHAAKKDKMIGTHITKIDLF